MSRSLRSYPDQVTLSGHIQRISTLDPCACRETSGEHDSALRIHENRNSGQRLQSDEGVSSEKRKIKDYAFNSTPGNSGRGGCPAMAGESLHSHAGINQVNSQRRRSHRRGPVAAPCVRALSLASADPRRHLSNGATRSITRKPNASAPRSKQGNTAGYFPEGDILKNRLLLVVGITLSLSAFAQTNSQTAL